MKKFILAIVLALCSASTVFAHEVPKHQFSIGISTPAGKQEIFRVVGGERLADVLSENLAATIRAFKAGTATELTLSTSNGGKITLFTKEVYTVYADDLTPEEVEKPAPKEEKKPCCKDKEACAPKWVLVRHCGNCPTYMWVYKG